MPTPSTNPPPQLPPRSHTSTCPEDSHAPDGYGSDSDAADANFDHHPMSPAPVNAPVATGAMPVDSRSTTESPRPDSRSGATPSSSATAMTEDHDHNDDPDSAAHKLADVDSAGMHAGQHNDTCPASAARRGTALDVTMDLGDGDTCGRFEEELLQEQTQDELYMPSMGFDSSNLRVLPTTSSSLLRPGSKFHGSQHSERQVYDVQVEIKYVDLQESFLCGYLKIQGLTEDNPTLTTYFEGEIIGNHYGFLTKHESWGATEKIDLNHWSKFAAFRQYKPQVRRGGNVPIPNLANRDNIFMRWKEHFLVPDHRVTTINGASFEGFYYICFNQKSGDVSGIYFHSRSEKFQQLELKHVEDKGCAPAMEFR